MNTETENRDLTIEEATAFFSKFYRGVHHIPNSGIKEHGPGWAVNHDRAPLATFDFSDLTRLVILAHDECIRVEVTAVRQNIIRIAIWKRQGRDGSISERHPTIEQAIETFRGK